MIVSNILQQYFTVNIVIVAKNIVDDCLDVTLTILNNFNCKIIFLIRVSTIYLHKAVLTGSRIGQERETKNF